MSQTIKQDPSSSSSSLPLALAAVSPPSSPLTIASRSPSPPAWFDPATNKTKTKKTVSFAEEDEVRIITPRKVTGAKKASKTKTLAYSSSSSSSSNNNDMQEIQSEAFVPRRSVRAIVISKRKAEADADAAVAVTKRVKKEKTSAVTATTAAGNKKGKAKGKEIDAAEEAPSGPGKLGRGKGEVVEVAAPVGHNATSAAEPDARVTRSLSRKRSAVEDAVGAGGAAKKQKIGESSRVGELVGGGGSSSGAREHIPGRGAIAGNAALQPGENGVYYLALGKDMSSDWLVERGIAHTPVTIAKVNGHKTIVAVNNGSITIKLVPSVSGAASASAHGIIYIIPKDKIRDLELRLRLHHHHSKLSSLPALVLSPSDPDAAPGDWHRVLAETGETLSVLVAVGEAAAEEDTEEAALEWLARPENSRELGQINQGILDAMMDWSLPATEIRKWVPRPPNPYARGVELGEEVARTRSDRVGGGGGARGGAKNRRRR